MFLSHTHTHVHKLKMSPVDFAVWLSIEEISLVRRYPVMRRSLAVRWSFQRCVEDDQHLPSTSHATIVPDRRDPLPWANLILKKAAKLCLSLSPQNPFILTEPNALKKELHRFRQDIGLEQGRKASPAISREFLTASPRTSPTLSAINIGELTIFCGLSRELRSFS